MQNVASGGGTWVTYNVTMAQLESRVGAKIAKGAPGVWAWVKAQVGPFFTT
jgi:putative hydrolases of HD superfamily